MHVVPRRDMIKATIQTLEYYLKVCKEQFEKHGDAAGQCTVIFDMENFSMRQYMWRPGRTSSNHKLYNDANSVTKLYK